VSTGIPAARLDLRAHACPLTWVKARVALSRLAEGEVLEVILLDGEPRENVPRSAREDGHGVLRLEPAPEEGAGAWRAWLRRGAPLEDRAWP
jgi:tRNA 2-thiouridine synthesizing protein A